MTFVAVVAMSWWALSVSVLSVSSLAAAAFPGLRRCRTMRQDMPPVSAIVPIDFLDSDFVRSQASLFRQSYPDYEILFAISGHNPMTTAAARRLQASHPAVPSRIVRSDVTIAGSPKLNTLWHAYA